MATRLPAGVQGVRLGRRHAMAEQLARELAAADGTAPVAFLVADTSDRDVWFSNGWAVPGWQDWFATADEAHRFAAACAAESGRYQVGVFAVVQLDGGLNPGGGSC